MKMTIRNYLFKIIKIRVVKNIYIIINAHSMANAGVVYFRVVETGVHDRLRVGDYMGYFTSPVLTPRY